MQRYQITYKWRNKIRYFTTLAACEQLAIWQFSKDKALKDSEFINIRISSESKLNE